MLSWSLSPEFPIPHKFVLGVVLWFILSWSIFPSQGVFFVYTGAMVKIPFHFEVFV